MMYFSEDWNDFCDSTVDSMEAYSPVSAHKMHTEKQHLEKTDPLSLRL